MTKVAHKGGSTHRRQGLGEEIANAISHGLGSLLCIVATVLLLLRAAESGARINIVSAALYGGSMILLYSVSCIYHALVLPRGKLVFQILDHCSIFLLILGSYIPIALVGIGGAFGWAIFAVLTACAILGVVLNAVDLQRFKKLSMVLYFGMGWIAVFTIRPMLRSLSVTGLVFFILGGLFYSLGVIFYKKKELKYMHFIWHLFVIAGTAFHFFMIYMHFC